jgi:prevent-host-death family protein
MESASIRDLRNHGGELVGRAARGEAMIITRDGSPVAELRPLPRPALSSTVLLQRWHRLPAVDPDALRADIDNVLNPVL